MPLKVAPEDWQNSRGVLASNRYMLDNQVECDVQFVISTPDGARVYISAHSYVLISRSPVFNAMLNGPMAENKNRIRICDVTPEAFNHLLGWVQYTTSQLRSAHAHAIDLLRSTRPTSTHFGTVSIHHVTVPKCACSREVTG